METIYNLPKGRNMRPSETMRQIGAGTLMGVGYQSATLVAGGDYIKFKVSHRFWLTVKLNGKDLYDVEVGRMRKLDYVAIAQELDVEAERLSKVVRELGDRE